MNEGAGNPMRRVYDRALLLHGSKRNEVLSLAEIEQYGLDSFADADYVSIYGMPPREWYRHGIRLLGRLDLPGIDYCAIAKGYGVPAVRIATRDELAAALVRSIASDSPSLIEVPISSVG